MEYKNYLQSLTWDEFQTYKSYVNIDVLTDEQKKTLSEETARRANQFNKYMSF